MKTAMSNVVFKCVVINKINCRTVQCGRVVIGLPLKGYRLLLATTTQCHIYTLPTTNRQITHNRAICGVTNDAEH